MKKQFEGKFIVELPPRRDCDTTFEKHWALDLTEGIVFEGQGFAFPEGLTVDAVVRWLEESLLSVRLSFRGTVAGECSRCLEKATLAISDDLMYLYYPRDVELGRDTGLQSDEGFMPVEVDFFGRALDISGQIEESVLVLLPVRLLCGEDCAGLCQYCGADRNRGACSCGAQEGDPRFELLRDLVDEGPVR